MTSINENILRKLPRKNSKDIKSSFKDKYEDKNLQNVNFLRIFLLKEELESFSSTII
jgi:hypothetical protein